MDITGNFQRSNRPKLRALMSEGVDLRMAKAFERYELIDDGVRAHFKDGSTCTGRFLIGCEGAVSGGALVVSLLAACIALILYSSVCPHATVRKQLVGEAGALRYLKFTSLAAVQTLTHEEAAPVRAIDPLMFQAIQPDTKTFLWHSVQRSEPDEDALDLLTYISYPVQDLESGLPMTASDEEVITDMKKHAAGFCEPLRSLVCNIKPGTPITRIQLRDWISQPWIGGEGRVSLAGDAGPYLLRLRSISDSSSHSASPHSRTHDHVPGRGRQSRNPRCILTCRDHFVHHAGQGWRRQCCGEFEVAIRDTLPDRLTPAFTHSLKSTKATFASAGSSASLSLTRPA